MKWKFIELMPFGWLVLERSSNTNPTKIRGVKSFAPESCEFEPRSWRGVLDTTLCDKFCQKLATSRLFSLDSRVYWPPRYNCKKIFHKYHFMTVESAYSQHVPWYCFCHNLGTHNSENSGGIKTTIKKNTYKKKTKFSSEN
jgi:hypothetical protein